jgi:2-desacetyl-2-hydroxyethyl bacteriochlorophyllide A dehydrogenase
MKAVSIIAPGDIRLVEAPVPKAKPQEALIKIKAAMICGSDISAYRGKGVPLNYPLVIGHEVAGEIYEIAENEYGLKKGDRVILNPYIYCGECYPCSLGRTNCCEHLKVLGVQTDGAMSEYFAHPAALLIKVPDSIPWELIPLAEPLTISMHALHRTGLKKGEHAVIVGAGPIGIYAALAAKARGAIPILLDMIDERLELAQCEGIAHTVNTSKCDSIQAIAQITKGRMAEVVIDASGANAEIRRTLEYASYCGRIALTGWPSGETPMLTPLITRKELEIVGSRTGIAREITEAISLIASGEVNVKACISEMVAFEELPQAVMKISQRPQDYLKIGALLT